MVPRSGISVRAVMTDNAATYTSHAWRRHCLARGLRHLRTRPYTPRTNGKAGFIQILLRTWAYAFAYPTSAHRTRALIGWLRWYNRRRMARWAVSRPSAVVQYT